MKKYNIIYADPPWRYNDRKCNGACEHHYNTMKIEEICKLPILTVNDIVISSSKWAYCKKCREPMLDMTIQPKEHFLKRNENFIEHDTDIHLMLKGFI